MRTLNDSQRGASRDSDASATKEPAPARTGSSDEATVADLDLQDLMRRQRQLGDDDEKTKDD